MKYKLIKETLFDDNIGSYESFGIEFESGEKVSDISVNKDTVEKFVNYINLKVVPFKYIHYEIEEFFEREGI
mgnify:CR=1 FL=1